MNSPSFRDLLITYECPIFQFVVATIRTTVGAVYAYEKRVARLDLATLQLDSDRRSRAIFGCSAPKARTMASSRLSGWLDDQHTIARRMT